MRRRPLALLVGCVLLAAACGDADDDTAGGPTTEVAAEEGVAEVEGTAGEGGPPTDTARAAELVVAIGTDETSLNPYTYVSGYPGWNLMTLVHDTLLVLDERNAPQPLLATDWQVDASGTTYTLRLRDDVTWHDGEAFDADDVVFTFDLVTRATHPRWTPGVAGVASVTAPDPTTVEITLERANPDFPVRPLADMPILAEHVWSDVTDPQSSGIEENVGTGPYRLTGYEPGQRYVLEANDDWAMGAPTVGTLVLPIIPDPSTAFAALRAGDVDMVSEEVEPQLVEQFVGDPDLEVASGPGFTTALLNISTTEPPLDRVELRRALSLAIDPGALVDTVLLGNGTPPNPAFLHPDGPLTDETLDHVHDPAEAAAVLDRLGAAPGEDGVRALDGERLSFELLSYANDPIRVRTAELVAEQLGAVGIEVTVSPLEAATVDSLVWPEFDVANGQDYELAMWRWTAPVQLDVARYGSLFHSDPAIGAFNVVGLADDAVDEAIEAVTAAGEPDERAMLLDELQALVADRVPLVPLYYADGVYAFRPATYDGWTFQDGQGLLHKLSLVDLG